MEDLVVGNETDQGAVLLCGAFPALVLFENTLRICGAPPFSVPPCRYLKIYRGGIDRLDTYTVESHALLEGSAVELAAGHQLAGGVHQLLQRYAAAEVAHRHLTALHGDDDLAAETGGIFIYRVVNHFLDQHIQAVVRHRAVPGAADVHAGAGADVGVPVEGLYRTSIVIS